MRAYYDARSRLFCYADAATGIIENVYKRGKTRINLPIGGVYEFERDDTITILRRMDDKEFEIERRFVA